MALDYRVTRSGAGRYWTAWPYRNGFPLRGRDLDLIPAGPNRETRVEAEADTHVAWERPEDQPCERGTVGCSVRHQGNEPCETW